MSEQTNQSNGSSAAITTLSEALERAEAALRAVEVVESAAAVEKAPKKAAKKAPKKASVQFKVLNKGTLHEAVSVRPNARLLHKLLNWEWQCLKYDQRELMNKAALKTVNTRDLESVVIPMSQFLEAINIHGPHHVNMMMETFRRVDANLFEAFREWNTAVYEQHITDIIEKNKPFEFNFLVNVLNRFANPHMVNRSIYDDSPLPADIDLPIMFLDKGQPGEFRTPAQFISAREQHTFFGSYVTCSIQVYRWETNALCGVTTTKSIPFWEGEKTLESLGIQFEVTEEECAELAEVGKKVIRLSREPSYVLCSGTLDIKTFWGYRKIPASGRAMVDHEGMELVKPSGNYKRDSEDQTAVDVTTFNNKKYALIEPYLHGFSFAAKQWGRFHAGDLTEINFRKDAFDQLVMDTDDKKLILSLVKHVDPSRVTDFIDGKGGGCTFLFHGKPGLGKTLTAEAVAETVQRPLYAASVGELGVDVDTLETNLQTVLQLAARWNAVLLLDEADIFLEERSRGDIHRNAMVGTFLRLLEYYNGILILTSNRVKAIDPAFYSRISFARKYHDHTDDVREQIVRNLLNVHEITLTEEEICELALHEVNGRQIKNSIRLAHFLAESENRPVTGKDIHDILLRVQSFAAELLREVNLEE